MSKILCTICARGGSKGVKNKNIRQIAGLALIAHTINQARECGLFDHIVISTDSDEIASVAQNYGGEVFFKRNENLASDNAGKIPAIRDALIRSQEHYKREFPYIIDLDATSPLRLASDIKAAFKQFIDDDNDILITATPSRRSPYFNLIERQSDGSINLSKPLPKAILRRQDAPQTYDMNASIYIWKSQILLTTDTLFIPKTGLYIMPQNRSIDIDDELDFMIVEHILRSQNA
ncbi:MULTISPECIES: acylneuraminate cytidylyltransferase family protein [Campylobacter]|uniref:acylneuraminate cytidylyltransferase family protein n=1 Tax=Campylobacter TaxID=194 RepID=UPI000A33FE73|nr:acylneuraminate cytidylyltransferase family protein [Campylobacter sp. P0024]MCR8679389.1 acylneuraminate cytidylyltransferase family protein [Campylobacter sp. RM19072]